jgi:cell pole-organizing protein PopZ
MTPTWVGALDDFGRALLSFEEQLDLDPADSRTFAFQLPVDLGPLPPELLGVAARLVERSASVEDHVASLLANVAREQAGVANEQAAVARARNHTAPERPPARFVDVQS